MNHLILLCEVIATPTLQTTANNKQLCKFFVRVNSYKEEDGPWELAVTAWGQTAARAADPAIGAKLRALLVMEGSLRLEKGHPPELQLSRFHVVSGPVGIPGVNTITLVGRAGRDPDVRYFESGSVVANLTLAVNRLRRDDDPDWFSLAIWGKPAQVAADYVRKGSQLGIIGSLGLERWTDRASGEERSKPMVRVDRLELLGSRRDSEAGSGFGGEPSDEEVPF